MKEINPKEINPKILETNPKRCIGILVPILNELVVESLNGKTRHIAVDVFFNEFRTRFLKKIKEKDGVVPSVGKIEFYSFISSCADLHDFDRFDEFCALQMTFFDYIQYMFARIQENNLKYIEEKENDGVLGCRNIAHYQKQAMFAASQFIGTSDKHAVINAFSSKQSVEIADKNEEKNIFEKLHQAIEEKNISAEELRILAENDSQ